MKEFLLSLTLLASPMAPMQYEPDVSTKIVIVMQVEGSKEQALLGCFPLRPTLDPK